MTDQYVIRQSRSGFGRDSTHDTREGKYVYTCQRYLRVTGFACDISCECTKWELPIGLDLFFVPLTRTTMKQGSWVEYHVL